MINMGILNNLMGINPMDIKELVNKEVEMIERIAELIHYPECWDDVAYPRVMDAMLEVATWYADSVGCTADVCKHGEDDGSPELAE